MTAANFLWNPGTTNNGLTAAAFTLLNAELNTLATNTFAVSSGSFSNTNSAQAVWAQLFLTLGTIASALSQSANCCGWFLQSYDGGTTYEQSGTLPARPPDFFIPLPAAAITAGTVWASSGLILLPTLKYKVALQNNSNQTLAGSSANTLRAAPVNMQSL